MRCWVKSRNERNPRRVLPPGRAGHSRGTAGVKPEEGGDDVKSSCPLCPGLHTCYNGRHNGMRTRERERTPQSRPQFGSGAATRPREVGVASNRGSARRGECVPGPCTHRPSHHPSRLHPKSPARSGAATRPREVGVASNRGSARRGECVPGPCTHRPSHHPSRLHPKSPAPPGEAPKVWGARGVKS